MRSLRSLSTRTLAAVAAVSVVGLLFFGSTMLAVTKPLLPNTIVALELAFTPANAAAILRSWGDTGTAAARESLLVDVGFILLGYAPLLASLCLLSASRPEDRARTWAFRMAHAALVAGALDLVENAALWGVTGRPLDPSGFLTWTAGLAAAAKFVLAFAAVGFVLWFGVGRGLNRVTPLVQWFLSAPILVAIAALVLLVLWRAALASLGIPDLFWSESASMQVLAGIGVGALIGHLGVLGFLLDTQRASILGGTYCADWSGRIVVAWVLRYLPMVKEAPVLLAGYLVRTSVPLLAIALASALRAPGGVSPWWLPMGALGAFAVSAWLSVWLSHRRVPLMHPTRVLAGGVGGVPEPPPPGERFVIVQVAVYGTLWVLYRLFERGVSVALAVCVLLGAVASAYGFLKYFFPAHVYGVLAAAFVVYVALNAPPGHHLPGLDYYNRVLLNRQPARDAVVPRTDPHLEAWKTARGGPAPLVVVAVDGGGIRAAVWTTVVMAQLERDLPTFPYSVRIVTGASGGMVGIASWVASLQPPASVDRHRDLDAQAVTHADLVDRVATDSLGTVAREMVFRDLILPPFLHPTTDRGLALERAWERSTRILGQRFSDLGPGEAAGWRPSLIVSPLIVEDGRRLLISNADVSGLTTVPVEPPTLQALQYFGHIEPRPGTLRLSTAVRLNASFPYVSPAAELPTDPARHTLDAGYYDEHGVELAGTWIWTHREWLAANTTGVLLVQVPDARARARKAKASEDRKDWWGAGLLGVTGPVQALRTSQSASTDYRNDQLVSFLDATLNAGRPGFFGTVVFEPDETSAAEPPPGCGRSWIRRIVGGEEPAYRDVALSWRLTGCEVSRLKQAIRGNESSSSCADRERFQDWWNAHKTAADPAVSVVCRLRCGCGTIAARIEVSRETQRRFPARGRVLPVVGRLRRGRQGAAQRRLVRRQGRRDLAAGRRSADQDHAEGQGLRDRPVRGRRGAHRCLGPAQGQDLLTRVLSRPRVGRLPQARRPEVRARRLDVRIGGLPRSALGEQGARRAFVGASATPSARVCDRLGAGHPQATVVGRQAAHRGQGVRGRGVRHLARRADQDDIKRPGGPRANGPQVGGAWAPGPRAIVRFSLRPCSTG